MLVRIWTCQNATLFEISCRGSIIMLSYHPTRAVLPLRSADTYPQLRGMAASSL